MKSADRILTTVLCILISNCIYAQDKVVSTTYSEIPPYPEKYTAATVAARMIDGVGFRYYWATDGLRNKDLSFRPNDEARSSFETLRHIYGLSLNILRAMRKEPNEGNESIQELDFNDLRNGTLENLKAASDILKSSRDEDLETYKIIYKSENGTYELPFWNLLNGQIADALWHIGQVVSFRRSSGNPFDSKINVLTGKKAE